MCVCARERRNEIKTGCCCCFGEGLTHFPCNRGPRGPGWHHQRLRGRYQISIRRVPSGGYQVRVKRLLPGGYKVSSMRVPSGGYRVNSRRVPSGGYPSRDSDRRGHKVSIRRGQAGAIRVRRVSSQRQAGTIRRVSSDGGCHPAGIGVSIRRVPSGGFQVSVRRVPSGGNQVRVSVRRVSLGGYQVSIRRAPSGGYQVSVSLRLPPGTRASSKARKSRCRLTG